MKKFLFVVVLTILANHLGNAQNKKKYKVSKTNKEWRTLLTKKQYYVLREAGTEHQNSSPLNKNYSKGIYVCVACKTPLYESKHKYNSGSGWPAFDRAIKKNVELDVDYKIGYARTELKCNTCGGHLGHSFNDGPRATTGKRHCINGAALKFIPKK
ncbi:peptide-methionine (R)-S-oxide reductase MsrB [Tenacibaculum ovolyticum]|uniref:peptide-methionine (R)-S-oxide reductase MsrB n=1 Tax=Tenacibaculum ovolyticum TaxID=104270 RepID=UPI001EEF4A69|nr:peptide-methionine (R)-S-oxide reductase MsrB [Tenacibaculum ovolyticum]